MAIDFFTSSNNLHIRQSFISPTVYLDHWAISLFSEEIELQDRFISALKDKNGTLLISTLSFLEFSNATDPKHSAETELFLDRVLPHLYFTDFNTDKVEIKEALILNNENRFWPSPDLLTLNELYKNSIKQNKLTTGGMLQKIHNERAHFIDVKENIIAKIRTSLDDTFLNEKFINKARHIRPSEERTRSSIILGELIRDFVLDSKAIMSDNDIIDLIHAWTSTNCCDYTLLDNAWMERVKKMENRLLNSPTTMSIARCYSKKMTVLNYLSIA